MATVDIARGCRKALAIASIVVGGTSVALPDPWSRIGMAVATSLNAASLYLLKEEKPDAASAGKENP
jgi:hypothetical protein